MLLLQIYGYLLQIYGYGTTDLWSFATDLWCYPQAPNLIATDLWCPVGCTVIATDLRSWCHLAFLLQIYGLGETFRFCYRFMVSGVVANISYTRCQLEQNKINSTFFYV